jgi:hypothetical protein
MLVQDFKVQLIRPPIVVRRTAPGFVYKRAFAVRHGALLIRLIADPSWDVLI